MDLSHVPEIDGATADKLREAGVPHAEALSLWEDVAGLAERVALSFEHVESLRDAARASVERKLVEAGLAGPAALATADLRALAERTGIEEPYLAHYQRKAREALGKVVLAESAPVARVHVGDQTHHAVPLVTAGAGDEDDDVLARAQGDAVLLKPAQEVVPVLLGGITHRALPLYKERRGEDGAVEEVRVRVVEIRHVDAATPAPEKTVDAKKEKKSGLGRLFSRK